MTIGFGPLVVFSLELSVYLVNLVTTRVQSDSSRLVSPVTTPAGVFNGHGLFYIMALIWICGLVRFGIEGNMAIGPHCCSGGGLGGTTLVGFGSEGHIGMTAFACSL